MVHVCVCARVSRVRGIIKLNSRILRERPAWREKGQGRNIGINSRDEEIRPLSPLLSAVAKRPVRKTHPATCVIFTRPIFSDLDPIRTLFWIHIFELNFKCYYL